MRENEKMRNASGQKVENEGSEKNSEQEHKQQNFCVHDDIFSLKYVTRKIRVATTAAKQCTKSVLHAKSCRCCSLLIRPIDFFLPFLFPSSFSITRF